jgi:hypothetical protein
LHWLAVVAFNKTLICDLTPLSTARLLVPIKFLALQLSPLSTQHNLPPHKDSAVPPHPYR